MNKPECLKCKKLGFDCTRVIMQPYFFAKDREFWTCLICKSSWSIMKKEECTHEQISIVHTLEDTHLCLKCKGQLVCNEIEIFKQFYEVGAFCDNKECERYLILVA